MWKPSKPEDIEYYNTVPGFICLVKKSHDDGEYQGIVENSFSMGVESNHARFYWTGTASGYSTSFNIDGFEDVADVAKQYAKQYSLIRIYDARDANTLPVIIDWDKWIDANEPVKKSLSGVKSKYGARNVTFSHKDPDPNGWDILWKEHYTVRQIIKTANEYNERAKWLKDSAVGRYKANLFHYLVTKNETYIVYEFEDNRDATAFRIRW